MNLCSCEKVLTLPCMENQEPVLLSPLMSHIPLPYKMGSRRNSLNPKGILVFAL